MLNSVAPSSKLQQGLKRFASLLGNKQQNASEPRELSHRKSILSCVANSPWKNIFQNLFQIGNSVTMLHDKMTYDIRTLLCLTQNRVIILKLMH